MRTRARGLLVLAIALAVALGLLPLAPAARAASPVYQLVFLPTTTPSAISRNGQFILGAGALLQETAPGFYQIVNTNAALQGAGPHDVNNSGTVAFPGGYFANGADKNSPPKPIPSQPLADSNDLSGQWTPVTATGINDLGVVAGWGTCPPTSDPSWDNCGKVNGTQTVQGTEGYYFNTTTSKLTFTGIASTPSDAEPHSTADVINDHGKVDGMTTTSTSQSCFGNTNDAAVEVYVEDLGDHPIPFALPDCSDSLRIKAVNDSGVIVGGGLYHSADDSYHAYDLQGNTPGDLGSLGEIPCSTSNTGQVSGSEALDINTQGTIVGDSNVAIGGDCNKDQHAVVWQKGDSGQYSPTDLNALNAAGKIAGGSGWVLNQATAIDENGDIVGAGNDGGSDPNQGFILIHQQATISGKVTNEKGKGIRGVTVTATGATTNSTTSAADGSYAMPVAPGSYVVQPEGGKYSVTQCSGKTEGDKCQVTATSGHGATASFARDEKLTVSFDPTVVAGDGYGATLLKVKLTDLAGHPIPDQRIVGGVANPSPGPSNETAFALDQQQVACQGAKPGSDAEFELTTDANGEAAATLYMFVSGSERVARPYAFTLDPDLRSVDATASLELQPAHGNLPLLQTLRSLYQTESGPKINIQDAPLQSQVAVMEWLNALRHDHSIFAELYPSRSLNFFGRPKAPLVEFAAFNHAGILDLPQLYQLTAPVDLRSPDKWEADNPGSTYEGYWWDQNHASNGEGRVNPDIAFEENVYPPPLGSPDRPAWDACLLGALRPASHQLASVQVFSPAHLLFSDSKGRKFGIDAHGKRHNDIPGTFLNGREPQVYALPPGRYRVVVTATGNGTVTLEASTPGKSGDEIRAFELKVRKRQHGNFVLNGSSLPQAITFAGRRYRGLSGLGLRVSGLPRYLRKGRKLKLRLTDQFGRPVPAAEITTVGPKRAKTMTFTDNRGSATIILKPHQRIRISALGYVTISARIS